MKRRYILKALERRQKFLEYRLKTTSVFYNGRSYDEAENNALKQVIAMLKGE